MNRHHRLLPRTLALLLGLVLLLASGFAAQRTLHVCRLAQRAEAATFGGCTRDCCAAEAATAPASCAHGCQGCASAAAGASRSDRERSRDVTLREGANCAGGCCFAVDIELENGPLPRSLDTDQDLPLLAILPLPMALPAAAHPAASARPFATGPPDPDRRTSLRRTIQLLI